MDCGLIALAKDCSIQGSTLCSLALAFGGEDAALALALQMVAVELTSALSIGIVLAFGGEDAALGLTLWMVDLAIALELARALSFALACEDAIVVVSFCCTIATMPRHTLPLGLALGMRLPTALATIDGQSCALHLGTACKLVFGTPTYHCFGSRFELSR